MAERPSWIELTSDQREELAKVVPESGWRVVEAARLPAVFPATFRRKIVSALLIAAPTSTGGTYLAVSAHRLDPPARAIDIEPFGVIVHSTGPGPSGVFIHHGDWEGRTRLPPASFWGEVERSGVGDFFATKLPAGVAEGRLDQLPKGDRGAFEAIIRAIRRREDDK